MMNRLLPSVFKPLDDLLGSIPLGAARWVVCGMFILSALAVFALRRDYIFLGAPDRKWWRDLRLWTAALIIPYLLIYLFL